MSGTLSATAAMAAVPPRQLHKGVIAVPFLYSTGATSVDASATVIQLCKIPNKATILDFVATTNSTGAATAPTDWGVSGGLGITGPTSALASAVAQGGVTRSTKAGGVPLKISLSDDATNNYVYFQATVTPSSATASVQIEGCVYYTMDGLNP